MENVASSTTTASSQSQLNFLDYPSNQEVSPWSQAVLHNVSNVRSTTRNCKTSYSAPRASERGSIKTAAISFTSPRIVVDDIMKGMPTHDVTKMAKNVTISTYKCSHTFQEGLYSKKST